MLQWVRELYTTPFTAIIRSFVCLWLNLKQDFFSTFKSITIHILCVSKKSVFKFPRKNRQIPKWSEWKISCEKNHENWFFPFICNGIEWKKKLFRVRAVANTRYSACCVYVHVCLSVYLFVRSFVRSLTRPPVCLVATNEKRNEFCIPTEDVSHLFFLSFIQFSILFLVICCINSADGDNFLELSVYSGE